MSDSTCNGQRPSPSSARTPAGNRAQLSAGPRRSPMLDRGLELPVEAVEGLLQREARHHDAHRLVLLLLGRDSRERVIEEVGLAQSFFVALLEHPAQLGRRALQAQ